MTFAVIIPAVGTVVLREDGTVIVTDRERRHYQIAAEIVAAIADLVAKSSRA